MLRDFYFGSLKVFTQGRQITDNIKKLKAQVAGKKIKIMVNLNSGQQQAVVWTSDLSEKYVRINKKYS